MSDGNGLPTGWAHCVLDDLVLESLNGFGKRSQAEGVPVIVLRLADITDGLVDLDKPRYINATTQQIEQYALNEHDLLAIRVNGSADLVGRLIKLRGFEEPVLYCDHFIRLRLARPELASYVRLYADTHPFRDYVDKNKVSSAGQNTVSQTTLAKAPIPVAPPAEQIRITDRIDELFTDLVAGVAALERVRKKLKRYRSAVLHAAVTGRLTEAWRKEHRPPAESGEQLLERLLVERRRQWEERTLADYEAKGKQPPKDWRQRYQEPLKAKTDGLSELPEGWCWASVDQVGWVQLGRQRSPHNRSNRFPTQYIRAANLTEAGLDLSDVLDMEFTPDELKRYRLQLGDILLSEASGSADQVGKPAVWRDELSNCAFQNTVVRLRPTLTPDFLHLYFKHCYVNRVFARMSTGVGINHLSAGKFSGLEVPLPALDEQERIVEAVQEKLSQIGAMETEVARGIARASRLRQAILKSAFAGELVTQDPHDEPASVLLGRIRAEREAIATESPGRPKRSPRKKAAPNMKTAKKKASPRKARKS